MFVWISYIFWGLIISFVVYAQLNQRKKRLSKIEAKKMKEEALEKAIKEREQIAEWKI